MSTYESIASDNNNGSQQVTTSPKQELTSLNANKILFGLFDYGVYSSELEISTVGENALFTIKEGTTFIFEKEDPVYATTMVSKIRLQEDAAVNVPTVELYSGIFFTAPAIMLVASWKYNVQDHITVFAKFHVLPYTPAVLAEVALNKDVILAVAVNHQEAIANNDTAYYKISYQNQFQRNLMQNIGEINAGFPISFGHDIADSYLQTITVGEGSCILGDTYISNPTPLVCKVGTNWPTPVLPSPGAGYYQIDVLRMKTEREGSADNTPYLEWVSFLKASGTIPVIKSFLNGYNFTFTDIGYNLLFAVRNYTGLLSTTNIWPSECLISNPFMPQLGIPETSTRFKLPVY